MGRGPMGSLGLISVLLMRAGGSTARRPLLCAAGRRMEQEGVCLPGQGGTHTGIGPQRDKCS